MILSLELEIHVSVEVDVFRSIKVIWMIYLGGILSHQLTLSLHFRQPVPAEFECLTASAPFDDGAQHASTPAL